MTGLNFNLNMSQSIDAIDRNKDQKSKIIPKGSIKLPNKKVLASGTQANSSAILKPPIGKKAV